MSPMMGQIFGGAAQPKIPCEYDSVVREPRPPMVLSSYAASF